MAREIPPYPTKSPEEFYKLPEPQQQIVLKWIEQNFTKRSTKNPKASVRNIRNLYQNTFPRNEENYLTKDEIFGAMLAAGFDYSIPHDVDSVAAYYFNAGFKSPTKPQYLHD